MDLAGKKLFLAVMTIFTLPSKRTFKGHSHTATISLIIDSGLVELVRCVATRWR